MGVITYEHEITSSISPARLLKAFLLDADNIIGSKFTCVKHKVDKFDQDNFTYGHGLIERDVLMGKIEKISNETKLVASPNGGSIVKTTSTYYTIGDAEVDEEHVKEVKEKGSGLFKLVGGYLHVNPIC